MKRSHAGRYRRFERAGRVLLIGVVLACSGCNPKDDVIAEYARTIGEPDRGRQLIFSYGCGSCHVVPGVPDANGDLGPSLRGFGGRAYIAGSLQNTPANLGRWILDPQEIEPGTAMPPLGVSPEQARHIVSYLYTLQ